MLLAGGGWGGQHPTSSSAAVFDPAINSIVATGSMLTPRERYTATLLGDGRVLIVGGANEANGAIQSAELYDPKTGKFSPTGSLSNGSNGGLAILLHDGRVLVIDTYANLADLFDPATGTFSPRGAPVQARHGDASAALMSDGRVLLVGGRDDQVHAMASAEIYDPSTGAFTATGFMNDPRVQFTATALDDGRVLIVGALPRADASPSTPNSTIPI